MVVIVTDGLRWQEVFRGAETALVSDKPGGVEDVAATKAAYWRPNAPERREAPLPFFWTVIAKNGQLYGNVDAGSSSQVTNGYKFSYPGYNEIITGAGDPRIDRNEYGPNPNDGPKNWKHHAWNVEGAENMWIAVLGPDTPALGERRNAGRVTQSQIAATVAALFGRDWRSFSPEAGAPLAEAIAPAPGR